MRSSQHRDWIKRYLAEMYTAFNVDEAIRCSRTDPEVERRWIDAQGASERGEARKVIHSVAAGGGG
jgi:hypothetical protein